MRAQAMLVVALAFGCASANEGPELGSAGTGGSGGAPASSGGAGTSSAGAPMAGTLNGGSGASSMAGSTSGGMSSGGMSSGGAASGGAPGGSGAGAANGGGGAGSGGTSSGGSSAGTADGGAGMSSGGGGASNGGGKAGMSSGGVAGVSGMGGASTAGTTATGGAGGCVENLACKLSPPPSTGDLHQDCVNRINQFLTQCACLPPLTRRADGEACADQMAKYDADNNMAHAGSRARICQPGGAQNSCPGYSSNEQVIGLCIQQMWDEGPPPTDDCTGDCFQKYGHFINMTDPSVTKVACGFYTTSSGKVWSVQNFTR